MRRVGAGLVAACGLAILTGCKDDKAPPPPVRPVLSVVVAPTAQRVFGFTGTVEPRYKVSLGFRVLGRLSSRNVEVADRVKAGTTLATIDAIALDLVVRSADADLANARARLANASAVETRQRYLLDRSVTSQAEFDNAQQSREAAAAVLQQREASLAKAREQLGYTQLRSDIDGVVTAIGAEIGQVVAAGQSVVTVARPDVREASVDVPEDVARELKPGVAFEVALQLDPKVRMSGQVREIGPQADATTRTRRVLISLPGAADVFRLGTTVVATVTTQSRPTIDLPLSALLEKDGKTFVLVVDPVAGQGSPEKEISPREAKVSQREVKVSRRDAGSIEIADGLAPGTRVITAGVNSLTPGQTVKISEARP